MTEPPARSDVARELVHHQCMVWILDLDGVVWQGDVAIPGSVAAIRRLHAAGQRVVFVTNNSSMTRAEYVAKLERQGVVASEQDIVSSAMAGARMLQAGSTALVCAGDGVREALTRRGVVIRENPPVDTTVVGWHRDFTFDSLAQAVQAIRAGSRFVATNDDPTYPAADGILPGCGSIVAFIATAAGLDPEVAGKPNPPMVELVRELVGDALSASVLVGDRASTDGALARALGVRFARVATGIDAGEDAGTFPPDIDSADLAAVVDQALQ
jgi:HAD superfamily hydrolase (TIGR01450 family)